MGMDISVPESFKNTSMSQAFKDHLDPAEDNLSDGIASSYGIIKYRGKVWTISKNKETKTVVRPDDGTPAAYLDIVILGQAKNKSKSYFKGWEDGSHDRPICSSMDGIVPDVGVPEQQSATCGLCPRNVWRTDPKTGRKGKECTDYKRLAVLVMPAQSRPTMGYELMEPMFLRVPPDSLQSLATMGDRMTAQGYHYSSYVTRITFDPSKSHPKMIFTPHQRLNDQDAPSILELRRDPLVNRIVTGDDGGMPALLAPSEQTLLPPPAKPALTPTAMSETQAHSAMNGGADPGMKDITPPKPAPVQDVGVPEDSDNELDSRIAAALSR